MLQIKIVVEKHDFRFVDFWGNGTFNTLKKHLTSSLVSDLLCVRLTHFACFQANLGDIAYNRRSPRCFFKLPAISNKMTAKSIHLFAAIAINQLMIMLLKRLYST